MKRMIEVNVDQVTDLIVNDLKEAYELNTNTNEDELLNALDVVLRYYMTPNQIDEWNKSKGAL